MITSWWIAKLICGLLLIGHFVAVATGLYALHSHTIIPALAAQVFVVVGATITLWHYVILKMTAGNLARPSRLVTDRGLFRVIRHPMYAGDLFLYAGLAMLTADPVSLAIAVVGIVAIIGQCRFEDRAMAEAFGNEFGAWKRHTWLLVPRIF